MADGEAVADGAQLGGLEMSRELVLRPVFGGVELLEEGLDCYHA